MFQIKFGDIKVVLTFGGRKLVDRVDGVDGVDIGKQLFSLLVRKLLSS
jgi:hypothetical protein